MTKKLTNKKYSVGINEDAFKKAAKESIKDQKKVAVKAKKIRKTKEYKGLDTGRGHIAPEATEKKPWDIKDKLLTRIKKYWDDVRFNR